MRERFDGHDLGPLLALALIEAVGCGQIADGKVGRLHKCPGQVLVAALAVPFALLLGVADPLALDAAAVGGELTNSRKSGDLPDLQCDGHGQDRPDAIDRLEHPELGREPQALQSVPSAHRWRPGHS